MCLQFTQASSVEAEMMESQLYTEGELWKIVSIEGKGAGAVAKADIRKGSG